MPLRAVTRRIAIAALLLPGSALAIPEPDDFVGPPSFSLMGCSYAAEWTPDYVAKATGIAPSILEKIEQKWQFTPAQVCVFDPRLVEGLAHPKKPPAKFDEPDKAYAQRVKELQDSDGTIPPNALWNALAQRQTLLEPPPGKLTEKGLLVDKAAGISSGSWTWLGPGNIGGRIRAISPDPTTPGKMLVGSVSGGIHVTTNSGTSATFTPVDDFMPNVAVSCLVRDPQVPATVYACTGEGFFNFDGIRGLGIFKSTNSGATWSQMTSTNPASGASPDWYYVNRLAVSPTSSLVMLAATNQGLYRTADGGSTWTKVYQQVGTSGGVAKFRRVLDVKFHPTDGTKAVLAEGKYCNYTTGSCVNDGSAVAMTTDAGLTWRRCKLDATAISGLTGRTEVSYAPSNGSVIYAVVDQLQGKVFKSTDAGVTWGGSGCDFTKSPADPQPVMTSNPAHLGTQGWYDSALWVAPNDPNRVLVAGYGMKMSLDGGVTWTAVANNVHVDHHTIVSDQQYATNFTVWDGNDGGLYKGTNANTTAPTSTGAPAWTVQNNNLGITQFYGGAGKAGGRIIGGAQDNGTVMWTGTTNWVRVWSSDGGRTAADQGDGNYLYGMTQYGGIVRYDSALASPPVPNTTNTVYICSGITDASCNFNNSNPQILFIPPMAIDPATSTTLFLGAQNLWRSQNIKDETPTTPNNPIWTAVRAAKPVNPSTGLVPWISAVSIAPGNSNLVWVGYDDGSAGCSTNAAAASPTFINVTMPSSTALRTLSRIAFDPSNPNRVIVAFTGYLASTPGTNLWTTSSGCTASPTWTNIHNQLPLAPIRGVAINPGNSSWIYAGTEVGVFASQDGGTNWSTTNDGPGTASVEELFFLDGTTLVAATHGRGMFTTQALPGTPPSFTNSPPVNGTVGVAYTHTYTTNGSPAATFALTGGSGPFPPGLTLNGTTGVLSGTPTTAGNYSGSVTATNTSGTATQAFSITIGAQLPGAPTIGTASPGNGQATISFTPPASNGGSPITSYTMSCVGPTTVTGSGTASPILVTGLTNGATYNCSVRATNSAGTGPASGTVAVTPSSGVVLALISVKSRKTHAAAGNFDLTVDTTKAIGGLVTVEPRQIGTGHKIVFTFNDIITATGTAACVDAASAPVGSVSAAAVGSTVEVTLTGVPDAKRVTVSLTNVNGTYNTSASLGFLLGDVNNNYKVTSSDILMITGRVGQALSVSNFQFDVNLTGAISSSDATTAKAQSGQLLP